MLYQLSYVSMLPLSCDRDTEAAAPHAAANAPTSISVTAILLPPSCICVPRAGDGARTRDIKLGRLALYQLSYSRENRPDAPTLPAVTSHGGGRIRTFEGLRRQIYSLIPLATREPHPVISHDRTA